jgi:hypothetical protein
MTEFCINSLGTNISLGWCDAKLGFGCIFIKPQQPHREYQVECHRAGDNEPERY